MTAPTIKESDGKEDVDLSLFLPNADLWDYPFNRSHPTQKVSLHRGGSGVTEKHIAQLKASVKKLQPPTSNTPDGASALLTALKDISSLREFQTLKQSSPILAADPLDLLPVVTPALSPISAYRGMVFSIHDAYLIEMERGPEKPFLDSRLGHGLLTYHPNFLWIANNRRITPFHSGCAEDRLLGLTRVFMISPKQPSDLRKNARQSPAFPAVDRSGTLPSGLKMTNVFPLPVPDPTFNLSLETVFERTAQRLLKRHSPVHRAQRQLGDMDIMEGLCLTWSGGIDTTAIICCFLRLLGTDAATWEQHKVSIWYTESSIAEHPVFYEKYITSLPGGFIDGHVRDLSDGTRIVVTGDPADMLFGTTWMDRAFKFEFDDAGNKNPMWHALDKPWEQVMPQVMRMHGMIPPGGNNHASKNTENDAHVEAWLEWIRPWVKKSPIPVKNVYDFCWWVSFGLKWQHDMVRTFLNRGSCDKADMQKIWNSVYHFYYTEEWQQWTYRDHRMKMPDKSLWSSYKYPLKKYILDYTGDVEYFGAKIKVPSATYGFGFELALDDQLHSVSFGALSISGKRMHEKYGHVAPGGLCGRYSSNAAMHSHDLHMKDDDDSIAVFNAAGYRAPENVPKFFGARYS